MPTTELDFKPAVIGHRGACGYAPENTMASFTKAAQMGIKWIEFDVMLAATGECVIIHDEQLNRTTNGKGLVQDHPLAYLRSLDAGSWFAPQFSGEKIPTLREVLELMNNAGLNANIELKPQKGVEAVLVKRILFEINESEIFAPDSHQFLFSSFSLPTLRLLRHQCADCQIAVLLHEWEELWQQACKELEAVAVHVNREILTAEKINEIKNLHKKVLSYTVNDTKKAKELLNLGVDAVFSDFPDVMAQLL